MNWSRAKTILIVFLLFTAIFLYAMIYTSNSKRNTISSETVENSIKILNSRGIKIDSSLIPNTIDSMQIYTVDNVVTDYNALAESILGGDVTQNGNTFSSNKGSIVFEGDRFSVTFTDGIDTDKADKSPSDKARTYLKIHGIDLYDTDVKVENDANGVFTATFTSKLGDLPFFDRSITCTLKGEKIISIEGSWFTKSDTATTQISLNSLPSILIKYSHENKEFQNIEISEILLGYAINENNVFHKQATVLPVYRITANNGKVFYVDAMMN